MEENPDYNLSHNNPPHRVSYWVALGDSFAAGPGAGDKFESQDPQHKEKHCMRRKGAYAPQLQESEMIPGPNGPRSEQPLFYFAACTGDKTDQLLETKPTNQLERLNSSATFATLSIGGNDILFGPILQSCILGWGMGCDQKKKDSEDILYGKKFHKQYNEVLTKLVRGKLPWSWCDGYTVLYQTSYSQYFDAYTNDCDNRRIGSTISPYLTKNLRFEMNHRAHQLNEVLQYWIDLRNYDWTSYSMGTQWIRWSVAVEWVDMDWKYKDHRFCREGVVEPDYDNPDTWFYHLPRIPIAEGDNQSSIWEVGPDFNPDNETALGVTERQIRTFHPKPAGFTAEKKELEFKLYEDMHLSSLPDKQFLIVCIGDFLSLGRHRSLGSEVRYGYLGYLHRIFNIGRNFGGIRKIRHRFIGSQTTRYSGDLHHEIYPDAPTVGKLAIAATRSHAIQGPEFFGRKVVLIMAGERDLTMGRKAKDVIVELDWMLTEIWKADKAAVVLLATLPMPGYRDDQGSEFYPLQREFISYNAHIAALCSHMGKANGRPIVKVHTTTTQREHLPGNPNVPDQHGYHRMARDFMTGFLQAKHRGYFDDPKFNAPRDDDELRDELRDKEPIYDLEPVKDEEKGYTICHQNRDLSDGQHNGPTEPSSDEILTSLFGPAKDQEDFVKYYACNKTVNCRFTWDTDVSNRRMHCPLVKV